jgi:predicted tellurium resistance membrane protein TerC
VFALFSGESLTALLTLTVMEIILGIDNIVFVAILVQRLPHADRDRIRSAGIFLALGIRILLLFSISWIMSLQKPLFAIFSRGVTGRDLILFAGGLFLIGKATLEIHHKLESAGEEPAVSGGSKLSRPLRVLAQILVLDVVFSLDSVITAVGMAKELSIMILAMLISMAVMLFSAKKISHFIEVHPTLKILALSFLILIGVTLVVESTGEHFSKGYIYFAMFFSLGVETLNLVYRARSSRKA